MQISKGTRKLALERDALANDMKLEDEATLNEIETQSDRWIN